MKPLMENWKKFTIEAAASEEDVLLENWRTFLAEEDSCLTVAEFAKGINISQEAEGLESLKQKGLKALIGIGKFVWSMWPKAWVIKGADFLLKLFGIIKDGGLEWDLVSQYPVLEKLKVNPYFVKIIEDKILIEIDEKYQEYLKGLDQTQCVQDIKSIDDFIIEEIGRLTNNRIQMTVTRGAKE
tara:strand:- start:3614 stop:4165 length:552 start_codon:yes stop_codon:yes gene_type:complete